MAKFIEIHPCSKYTGIPNMLIPVESITAVKQLRDTLIVFIKGLQLYAEDHYDRPQYKNEPDLLETEVIEVSNDYDEFKFLLLAGTVKENNG